MHDFDNRGPILEIAAYKQYLHRPILPSRVMTPSSLRRRRLQRTSNDASAPTGHRQYCIEIPEQSRLPRNASAA
jgi:hypothetical protein